MSKEEYSKKTILLVEDNAVAALGGTQTLRSLGYEAITVITGEEAIAIVRETSVIDLILMDIDLGEGMNGADTAETILRQRDIPIIFLSGHIEPEYIEKIEKIASYGYIQKGFSRSVLHGHLKMAFKLFEAIQKNRNAIEQKIDYEQQEKAALINNTDDLIWSVDRNLRLRAANRAFLNSTKGFSGGDLQPGDIILREDLFSEDLIQYWKKLYNQVLEGTPIKKEYLAKTSEALKDSWIELNLNPIILGSEITGVVCFARNITDRKKAEEQVKSLLAEKELILQEVHHRIKNNMTTLNAFLYLQAGSMSEPTAVAALKDAGYRVQSMTILYDKLYQSADFKEMLVQNYLPTLVTQIVGNFPNSGIVKIEHHIDDFKLDVKRLQPIGIILNELLTNSMKYAFIGLSNGIIIVSATLIGNSISLIVRDNGIGIPESISFEKSTGFGLRLVTMLTQQLRGIIRIERNQGTTFILEFDLYTTSHK